MKVLYICAPFATATEEEKQLVTLAKLWALDNGWAPIFMPDCLGFVENMTDGRELALRACEAVIPRCDSFLVVGTRRTEGMTRDLVCWNEHKGPFFDSEKNHIGLFLHPSTHQKQRGQ